MNIYKIFIISFLYSPSLAMQNYPIVYQETLSPYDALPNLRKLSLAAFCGANMCAAGTTTYHLMPALSQSSYLNSCNYIDHTVAILLRMGLTTAVIHGTYFAYKLFKIGTSTHQGKTLLEIMNDWLPKKNKKNHS